MPFLATSSAHILENDCTTLFLKMTRYRSTLATLRSFRRWAFAVTVIWELGLFWIYVGCFSCPIDPFLISTDLPHKSSRISWGFIVLSYLYNGIPQCFPPCCDDHYCSTSLVKAHLPDPQWNSLDMLGLQSPHNLNTWLAPVPGTPRH